MNRPKKLSKTLSAECEKLDRVAAAVSGGDLSIRKIVEAYHQAICVSSMTDALRQAGDAALVPGEISRAEAALDEFNSTTHPRILAGLAESVEEATKALQASNAPQTQRDAKRQSASYEELREKMSAREFVEQYGSGLSGDS